MPGPETYEVLRDPAVGGVRSWTSAGTAREHLFVGI
jgi:hypothetical protein